MTAPQNAPAASAAGEWRTRRSGGTAHYYPPDSVTSDGKALCGIALYHSETHPPVREGTAINPAAICEDCRELVGLLAS